MTYITLKTFFLLALIAMGSCTFVEAHTAIPKKTELQIYLERQGQEIALKDDMQKRIDEKIKDLEEKFEIKAENLSYKNNSLDLWFAILGIVISLFGIGIPIYTIIYVNKIRSKIEQQDKFINESVEKIKNNVDQFSEDTSHRMITIKRRTDEIELRTERLNLESTKNNLSMERKTLIVNEAELMKTNANAKPYDKDLAQALIHYVSDEYVKALPEFERILSVYRSEINIDNLILIYYKMGYCYSELNMDEKAVEYYKKTLDLKPDDSYAWNNLGTVYDRSEEYKQAIVCYQRSLELNPSDTQIWTNLGDSYYNLTRFKEANESYQRALELDPNNVSALNGLGNMHAAKGDVAKAIECYKEALERESNLSESRLNLIEALITCNRFAEANESLIYFNGKKNDDKDLFVIAFFNCLMNLVGDTPKDVDAHIKECKQTVSDDPKKVEWSFSDLEKWISTPQSDDLDTTKKKSVAKLIRAMSKWTK